jgi:DNA replication and repair protein RecF
MIKTLTITNFRNHESYRIHADNARAIIITGPNGSGKTSIIEAISCLSAGTGLRGATMNEILRIEAIDGFGVVANIADETEISVSWSVGDTYRRAVVDGDKIALSDLSAYLRMIWITPKEDRVFLDEKSDRRAFFDRLIAAFDPVHSGRTMKLSKLLSERSFALKNGAASEWLGGIEKQIAETAVSVAAARVKYVAEVNYFLSQEPKAKSQEPKAVEYIVRLSGWLEDKLTSGMLASDVERQYLEYIGRERNLVGDKMTIDGAHRSDFSMFNKSLNMDVSMTSTGQQKSALMALVVAHAKLLRAVKNVSPLILLDEAVAHLDDVARKNLFDALDATDAQVWCTGIDKELFGGIDGAMFIELRTKN